MPVSSRPSDKFALLLTGPTDPRYLNDLKSVFSLLRDYYNYPVANIWVVQGSTTFKNTGDYTGSNMFCIGSEADPLQKLKNICNIDITSFVNTISKHISDDPPPSGENCSVLIYTTGCRDGASSTKELVIRPGSGASEITISTSDFTDLIQYPRVGPSGIPLLMDCLISIIMQQDYSGNFHDSVIVNATMLPDRSFTNACGATELSTAGTSGGKFTEVWIEGLQFHKLDNLLVSDPLKDKYADELLTIPYKYRITFEQAEVFALKRSGASNYGFDHAGSVFGLGKEAFIIRDGDDMTTPRPYDQSPDIWIENTKVSPADNCYFDQGSNNNIKVSIGNIGTHPIRVYSVGIKIFRNGAAGGGDEHLSVQINDIRKPGEVVTYTYSYMFVPDIYHDIKAIVGFDPFTNLNTWNVHANDNEGERLIYQILTATIQIINPIICNGGTGDVKITATGGAGTLTYTFGVSQNNTGDFPNVPANPAGYQWSVTDANNCGPVTGTLVITEPQLLAASPSATPILCNGGKSHVTFTFSGGTSPYTFTFGSSTNNTGDFPNVPANPAGYQWSVTDANNCGPVTGTLVITEPQLLAASPSATPILCNGGKSHVTFAFSGGTSPYIFTFGSSTNNTGDFPNVPANPAGYQWSVTDANNCGPVTGTLVITEPQLLAASPSATPILCNGGKSHVTFAFSGGTSPYTFTFGSSTNNTGDFPNVPANPAGYQWSVTDANNCGPVTGTLVITEPALVTATISNSAITTHGGTCTVTISASGGSLSYVFTFNSVTNNDGVFHLISANPSGYSWSVVDTNGCGPVSGNLSIPVFDPLTVSIQSHKDVVCFDNPDGEATAIVTGGIAPYGYSWNTTPVQNSLHATGLKAGHYVITVTDGDGCAASVSVNIVHLYIDILHIPVKGITIVFKNYPRFPIFFRQADRFYEIHVRANLPYPPFPIHPHPDVTVNNIKLIDTHHITIGGDPWTIYNISVPGGKVGDIILHPYKGFPNGVILPVTVPVKIYLLSFRRFRFPIFRLLVAIFKLYVTNNDIDYR